MNPEAQSPDVRCNPDELHLDLKDELRLQQLLHAELQERVLALTNRVFALEHPVLLPRRRFVRS